MPFAENDFHILIKLLEQHPEWRTGLRRLVLSEELLTLPQLIRELSDNVRALGEQVQELVEAQWRTDERFAELAEWQRRAGKKFVELAEAPRRTEERLSEFERRIEERFAELAEAQRQTERVLHKLTIEVNRLGTEVGRLKGGELERPHRERAASYFQSLVRRIRLIDHETLGYL